MKILIIRFSSMGDVILTTPVFSYLKELDPNVQITLLTDKNYVELFSDDPRLKGVLGFDKSDNLRDLSFTKENWDFIIDLQNNRRSHNLILAIKNREKTTAFKKLHFQRLLLLLLRINLYNRNSGVIPRYLKAAGLNNNNEIYNSPKLHFKQSITAQYEKMIQADTIQRPAIALFPFSAWKNKVWPAKYFVVVGKYFISKGWNVVIMGSKSEQEQAEQLRTIIGDKAISFAGKLLLYECGCVLSNCSLALGNDSGLSHLARACGVKTGILYGPTTQHFGFYPSGNPPFKIFEKKGLCRPCHPHGGNICLQFNHRCMIDIHPEEVIQELMKLFHNL